MIEKSLSVDNVFMWAVIFSYFAVPREVPVPGAVLGHLRRPGPRAVFIFAGVALLERFDWILYLFGLALLFSAYRIVRHDATQIDPEHNPVLRLIRRVDPIDERVRRAEAAHSSNRAARRDAAPRRPRHDRVDGRGVRCGLDPAILAVSREEFIVFASNAFTILGLRALYFLLAGMEDRFRYLNRGLGVILAFVGMKMLITDLYHVPSWASLAVITGTLAVTNVASLRADRRDEQHPKHDISGR